MRNIESCRKQEARTSFKEEIMFAFTGKIAITLALVGVRAACGNRIHQSEDRRPRAIEDTSQAHIRDHMQCTQISTIYFRSHSGRSGTVE